MFTYKAEQCQRCNGKGKVRFLFLFKRNCPLCNGTGQIHIPQSTHEQDRRPFSVSTLSQETLRILKKEPVLLNCLSPYNKVDLTRKYGELRQPRLTVYSGLTAEKQQRINEEMMHSVHQRQLLTEFINRQNEFMQWHREQQNRFLEWSAKQQQQHQKWNNELFENFVHRCGPSTGH